MISLLAALMAGYALASLIKGARLAYVLCFPVSAIVYLPTKLLLTSFSDKGMQYPDFGMLLVVGVLQAPVLMLGVFLARRKAVRHDYDTQA